jgi:hypothetical protein
MGCIHVGMTAQVQLYAFDALMLDGEDLRHLPLSLRKTNLARLLARRPEGIFVSDFEQGEIEPDLFRKACEFEASRSRLPARPVAELGQGKKSQTSSDDPRHGNFLTKNGPR